MTTLRTESEEKFYQDWKSNNDPNRCPFCERDLVQKEFKYWILLENRFPYTKIAKKHYMLATKRHVRELSEMTEAEKVELDSLIYQINNRQIDFDMIFYNVPDKQSIPFHFHLHLIQLKK